MQKLEKLEEASKHPDLGPVGDGLITLMDQKLSKLDQRLYELSSKITSANVQVPEIKKEKQLKEVRTKTEEKQKKKQKVHLTLKLPKPVVQNMNQLQYHRQNQKFQLN